MKVSPKNRLIEYLSYQDLPQINMRDEISTRFVPFDTRLVPEVGSIPGVRALHNRFALATKEMAAWIQGHLHITRLPALYSLGDKADRLVGAKIKPRTIFCPGL